MWYGSCKNRNRNECVFWMLWIWPPALDHNWARIESHFTGYLQLNSDVISTKLMLFISQMNNIQLVWQYLWQTWVFESIWMQLKIHRFNSGSCRKLQLTSHDSKQFRLVAYFSYTLSLNVLRKHWGTRWRRCHSDDYRKHEDP